MPTTNNTLQRSANPCFNYLWVRICLITFLIITRIPFEIIERNSFSLYEIWIIFGNLLFCSRGKVEAIKKQSGIFLFFLFVHTFFVHPNNLKCFMVYFSFNTKCELRMIDHFPFLLHNLLLALPIPLQQMLPWSNKYCDLHHNFIFYWKNKIDFGGGVVGVKEDAKVEKVLIYASEFLKHLLLDFQIW